MVVLGPDYPDSFADNVASALRDLGAHTTLVDPRARYTKTGTMAGFSTAGRYLSEAVTRFPRMRQVLVDEHVSRSLVGLDPQLVIVTWGYFEAEQIERWRKETPNATWALWFPDAISNFGRQQMMEAPYDRLFFKDRYIVDLLSRRTDLPVHFLPQACNPARHRTEEFGSDEERARFECDVAVVGNVYPYRALLLEHLPDECQTKVYGTLSAALARRHPRAAEGFTGLYVTKREKALAFRGSKIVLNSMHYAELHGVNLRLFEATASGGFVLSSAIAGLDEYYEPGKEVAVFDNLAEFRESIEYFLREDDLRGEIAAAGQARAHRDHTYAIRLKEMLAICGLVPDDEG